VPGVTPSHILVVGSGGREHALAWRLAADAHAPRIDVSPGNDAMARAFTRHAVAETDVETLVALSRRIGADLVVVGPESALAAGLADALAAAGIPVFGPTRAAARLESSKWFAKEVMREAGVPTARAEAFGEPEAALAALGRFGPPWVVKADGLAAGKGVCVSSDATEARAFVTACLEPERFGAGGARTVVLEEFLPGEEASVIAVCDGERFGLLPAARDFKRALDGDEGPNTGGMGAYAPTAHVDAAVEHEVGERVVGPVLRAMAARGTPFRGALYCGLMLGPAGVRVVEFNARFGDPETQSIVPLLEGDFTALLASAAGGTLAAGEVRVRKGAAVTVALVDEGYPQALRRTGTITGLDALEGEPGLVVFHAGTAQDEAGWAVRGGRAAYITATGARVDEARARAYAAIARLGGGGWRCRGDIALARDQVGGRTAWR
jgi:phosphoribosylamine--glycine ligase